MREIKPYVIQPNDLRVGSQLNYDTGEGIELTTLDWQDIKWCEESNADFNEAHKPIVLTEELIKRVCCKKHEDNSRIEFSMTPPGERERQVDNNYWSYEVHDFAILHLSPSYSTQKIGSEYVKNENPDLWHVWICSHGTGSTCFMGLTDIHGRTAMKYFHQLQSLYYVLTAKELFIKQ
jgi:hypothetical protein